MSYFCMNAQEEALKDIAKQMRIENQRELLYSAYQLEAISKEKYLERIKEPLRYC